ncbi:MAG: transglycosylase domain-containing protein, partial [Chloroflexota bacterium]
NQYGIGDTPIPNPDQPPIDPDMTMVGQNWDATTATYAEPTLQGINYVDDQATMPSGTDFDNQATMPSNAQEYIDQSQYNELGVPSAQPQATGFETYATGEVAPTHAELERERQGNIAQLVLFGIVGFIVLGAIVAIGVVLAARQQYNTIVATYENEIAALGSADFDFQTATVLAADGTVIAELTGEQGARTIVSIENGDVSPWFVHAIVSSEDATYYENAGFDQVAIIRAFLENLFAGEVTQGASTITQQIVRERVLGSNEVSFDRKFTEVIVALAVAERYSKNEILDIYINEFFYGEQSYGVEAAAQFYFETSAADLDAAQAATLAGILPSPSDGNPVVSPEIAFRNMRLVLNRMIEVGCLDFQHGEWAQPGVEFCVGQDTLVDDGGGGQTPLFRRNPDGSFGGFLAVQIAQVETRRYAPRQTDIQYPHFVFYVLGELDQAFGRGAYIERGFTVQTTLVPRIQNTAENALQRQVDELGLNGVDTGAVLVTDPRTGAIIAMVGSPDFFDEDIDGQNNNTLSYQQPGSAIKPVVYADALVGENGVYYTPASIVWDVPTDYPLSNGTTYTPRNFDGRNRGPIPVRFALAQSLNIPAVKTYLDFNQQPFTPQSFIDMGNAMGIDFDPDGAGELEPAFGLATPLGSVEVSLMDLTQAYSTIANDGVRLEPYAVESIMEGNTEIEVPLSIAATEGVEAFNAQIAYLLQDILSDNSARSATINDIPSTFPAQSPIAGSSLGLANQLQVAVKTGTNNTENGDPSRLWTVGFTNNYTVGVWIGSLNQGTSLSGDLTGLTAASPIWNAVMQEALNGVNPGNFDRPSSGIQTVNVCRLTGTLVNDGTTCPFVTSELIYNQQPPPAESEGYAATLLVDSWTGLLANEACIGNEVERTFADIGDPFAVNWLNGTTRGQQILTQLGLPQNLPSPPQQACITGQGLPTVGINFPAGNTTVTEDVSITGQISAPNLQRWELQVAPINTENFQNIMPQAR